MSIADRVKAAKQSKVVNVSGVDRWIGGDAKKRKVLNEYLTAFSEERGHRFGWKDILDLLIEEFPEIESVHGFKREALRRWAEENHPAFQKRQQARA